MNRLWSDFAAACQERNPPRPPFDWAQDSFDKLRATPPRRG